MTKKEIEHRIKKYELVRECAEENLNELNIQLRDLCEAEKLKLRHGDFGYDGGFPRLTLMSSNEELFTAGQYHCGEVGGSSKHPEIILGNVFALLKEWSEPFEEWYSCSSISGVKKIKIKIINGNIHFGTLADGAEYSFENIVEIHNELGHAIAELKRKENKCSS